ncbi:hypothetical protein MKW92_020222 [Papaver armeniacum]|nr:hypothetical protein MKW92_020222 [Papaver armeniacum]
MEVKLHIYDVTNSGSAKTNNTIVQINKIFKDGIGLGGIFHSAIQIYGDEEWSFGYCEQGTGVFSCPPSKNPMYTYRECIVLGTTTASIYKVNQILRELSREWPGESYDLLSKNCNHFCDEFCERLDVPKIPGDMLFGTPPINPFRQAKAEIVTASKVAYRFLSNVTTAANTSTVNQDSPGNSNRGGNPRFQSTWFKNLMSIGARPPNSPELDTQTEGTLPHQQQRHSTGPIRQNSRDI